MRPLGEQVTQRRFEREQVRRGHHEVRDPSQQEARTAEPADTASSVTPSSVQATSKPPLERKVAVASATAKTPSAPSSTESSRCRKAERRDSGERVGRGERGRNVVGARSIRRRAPRRRTARWARRPHRERTRESVETSVAPAGRGRARDCEQEHAGRDHRRGTAVVPGALITTLVEQLPVPRVEHVYDGLREQETVGEAAERAPPALAAEPERRRGRDHRGAEAERGEAAFDRGRCDHDRHQAEHRQKLRLPGEREPDRDGSDDDDRDPDGAVAEQVVAAARGEQRDVVAADPRAGRRQRRDDVPESPADDQGRDDERTETPPPIVQRTAGPIQPRLAASAKMNTMPRSVTAPPATASPVGPASQLRSCDFLGGTRGDARFGGRGPRLTSLERRELCSDRGCLVRHPLLEQRESPGQRRDPLGGVVHATHYQHASAQLQADARRPVRDRRRTVTPRGEGRSPPHAGPCLLLRVVRVERAVGARRDAELVHDRAGGDERVGIAAVGHDIRDLAHRSEPFDVDRGSRLVVRRARIVLVREPEAVLDVCESVPGSRRGAARAARCRPRRGSRRRPPARTAPRTPRPDRPSNRGCRPIRPSSGRPGSRRSYRRTRRPRSRRGWCPS